MQFSVAFEVQLTHPPPERERQLLLACVDQAVYAEQMGFDRVWAPEHPALLVTEGGPRRATTYVPVYIYDQAFRYFRLGYASAISLTVLIAAAAVIAVQYRLARRWNLL